MVRTITADVLIDHFEHNLFDVQMGYTSLYKFEGKDKEMRSLEGKAFGELLGQFRTEVKLTQQQLADLMHKARGTIINWENGTYLPKERALVLELAKHLHLDSLKRDQLLEAAFFDPLGTIWAIPFKRNPFFTGREDVLDSLHKALHTDKTVALMQPQALKGLGGIGKTHTAIEYAYRHRDEYQAILWAPANTSSILQASLVSIATMLNLPQKTERDQDLIVKAVKQWLMNHADWLLILDNVEDLESAQSLYPWAHSGHVIMTTRSQSVGGIALSITLEKMGPEEGALFLLRRATLVGPEEGKEQAQGTDYEKAKELSEVLGGLPLALDQAAAYIEKTRCSLSTYLNLYQIERTKLLSERGSLTTDHPESVTVTFFLAFQKVKSASLAAGELLQFCAFLSPDAIPEEIITNGGVHLGSTLETIASDLIEFNTAIGLLLSYSLVRRDTDIKTGTQILSVHRLVQAVIQDTLEKEERRTWAERAVKIVNASFPEVAYETWDKCQRYLPHARASASLIKQWNMAFPEAARLLNETAYYLEDRAQYNEAEHLYLRSLAISELSLGANHSQVADTLTNLGSFYRDHGNYEQAEIFLQRALNIREQILGPDHLATAECLNNLAGTYRVQGKYIQAELLYQRSLAIREQVLKGNHPQVATGLNNLAMLYHDQGKYEQAEPLYLRALDVRERIHGPVHPDVAIAVNNLALLYQDQGKYEQAELLLKRALAIHEQVLGADHPDTAGSLNNLAGLYQYLGKYEQAEPLLLRSLSIREQTLGPDHLRVALTLNNLASLYSNQGKYREAEPLYQRALRIWEQLGTEHPNTATSLNNLAKLYLVQGKYEQVEPLLKRALAIREQQLGTEHPQVADSLNNLANLYSNQGKYREAELLYKRALCIREQQLGTEHPETAETIHDLAAFQEMQGNHQEALSLYQRAFVIREQVLGPEHPKARATHQRLAALRQSVSRETVASHQDDIPPRQSEQNI